MKSLILLSYITVCFLIIVAVFLQNGKGSQMGAAFSPQVSKNLFGSSGPKDFFYVTTKWLIAAFFSLALMMSLIDTKAQAQAEQQKDWSPVSESSNL